MESLPSHSISRILVFTLSLHNIIFMGALTKLRAQMTNEDKSTFGTDGDRLLIISGIVALSAVEVTSWVLFFTNIPSKYYTILKRVGIFSASLAPFLTLMVVDILPKHRMLYLLGLVFYGIAMACNCSGDDDFDKSLDKRSLISGFTYLGLVLVPLALVLVLCVPKNLDSMVYSVIYPIFGMEIIGFLIIYYTFMFMHVYGKPKAQDLAAHQVIIHQAKNSSDLKAQLVVQEDKKNIDLEASLDKKQTL